MCCICTQQHLVCIYTQQLSILLLLFHFQSQAATLYLYQIETIEETFDMPSRKRAKGKERRAKAKASFSNLILHDESKCNHFSTSTIPTDDICAQFVQQFEYELNIVYVSLTKSDTRFDAYDKVIQRLKRGNRFNRIWIEEEKQAQLLPLFVSLATNLLLKDEGYLLHRDTGLEPNGFEKGFLSQQIKIVVVAAVFS